jgi:S-adenosylmethionine:tRNA ribosyltransferase-isomerase
LYVVGPPARHLGVPDLAELLEPEDLLVVNDTRVLHARVAAHRASGGAVEVFFLGPPEGNLARVLCRPARRLKVGEVLEVDAGGSVQLLERLPRGHWSVACEPEPLALMASAGRIPLPPYLGREADASDTIRYQTVFAVHPGAVAAPTAGLHLSARLLGRLAERGVRLATATLHVGAGTFRPLVAEDFAAGRLHQERYRIPQETVDAVAACRQRGGRVVAVGTTSLRALESATPEGADRVPCPGHSVTELFIQPGYTFRCVDALVTNFHLPRSSLLVLASAIVGRETLLQAYRDAVDRGYRFYSYGDAMLLEVHQ